MRYLLLVLLLLPLSAEAQTIDEFGIIVPPDHYAYGPYPVVPPTLHRTPYPAILKVCQKFGYQPLGCTMTAPDRDEKSCDIYIRDDIGGKFFDALLLHEQAHCRGWGPNHPDWPSRSAQAP